jgi:hypothetical protein
LERPERSLIGQFRGTLLLELAPVDLKNAPCRTRATDLPFSHFCLDGSMYLTDSFPVVSSRVPCRPPPHSRVWPSCHLHICPLVV